MIRPSLRIIQALVILGPLVAVVQGGGDVDVGRQECFDGRSINLTALDGPVLSRRKRDFGGKEPIDWPKTYNAVFGVAGWMAQACEAFSDINFHLLGYNALGKLRPPKFAGTDQRTPSRTQIKLSHEPQEAQATRLPNVKY